MSHTEKICFGKCPEIKLKSGIREKFRSCFETFRIILGTFGKNSGTVQKNYEMVYNFF